jgi:hypothetical protein
MEKLFLRCHEVKNKANLTHCVHFPAVCTDPATWAKLPDFEDNMTRNPDALWIVQQRARSETLHCQQFTVNSSSISTSSFSSF